MLQLRHPDSDEIQLAVALSNQVDTANTAMADYGSLGGSRKNHLREAAPCRRRRLRRACGEVEQEQASRA